MAAQPIMLGTEQSVASPAETVLAPGLDLEPQAVTAHFDGAGAAGPFLACLSFYAQSGELMSRVFPEQQLAVGDDAVVTFAPFSVAR